MLGQRSPLLNPFLATMVSDYVYEPDEDCDQNIFLAADYIVGQFVALINFTF